MRYMLVYGSLTLFAVSSVSRAKASMLSLHDGASPPQTKLLSLVFIVECVAVLKLFTVFLMA